LVIRHGNRLGRTASADRHRSKTQAAG
jgi:hypothetical protein